jgi:hypothetical protein
MICIALCFLLCYKTTRFFNPICDYANNNKTFVCFFTVAPKQLTVKVRPEKLRPGQTVTITCESDSSNPVSRLAWLRGNGQVIQPAGNSTIPGAYSGIVSKSTLLMEVTPELHGVVITCQATNGIGPQIHDAVTLEVLCKFLFRFPSGC